MHDVGTSRQHTDTDLAYFIYTNGTLMMMQLEIYKPDRGIAPKLGRCRHVRTGKTPRRSAMPLDPVIGIAMTSNPCANTLATGRDRAIVFPLFESP